MHSKTLQAFLVTHFLAIVNSMVMTIGNSNRIAKTAECVLKLSAKYFVEKKALSGSIVIININSYESSTEELLLQTIHGGLKYSVMVKDSFYPHANASHFPEKAKNYMLILEEKSELQRNMLQLNKLPTWNPLAKAVVFYQIKNNETTEDTAKELINELRDYKLYRTIIFIYDEHNDEVISYTWKPYSETNCGGICQTVYILDICRDSKLIQVAAQKEAFPSDMKGCPLVVYAVVSEPYVMPPIRKLQSVGYNDVYDFQSGGEVNLVKIISNFTNMSLVMRMSDREEDWGMIYQNGTSTGAYSVLRNELADVMIGNIEVTKTLRKYFHPTVSYIQDEMTWCVPKATTASTWDNLVIIFQWTTWVATFVCLFVMGLLFHYLYYREHNKSVTKWPTNSLLMTFSMLLGWGASFSPKSSTFRILIFAWLCFSINMEVSYESFLRIFLMHPRFNKQISSQAELIESGISLGGRDVYRKYFEDQNISSFYLYRKYNTITFTEGVKRSALKRDFAVVASRRQAAYQDQELGKGAQLIFCFPESDNLYKYGVVLLARKWFPLLERFNGIIRSVSENGLISKWNQEYLYQTKNDGSNTIVPLSTQHLLGAFMLIGLMYCMSLIIFLVELISVYLGRRNMWNKVYIERFGYVP
ncbi:hypothetical protein K1T71_010994 [Dendrolimus kikuchii]|uniref:Uncharacterized protein n=1 Tax=Dendrolimus kikuchii TaxID=765133 RepID=A0ACC1CQN3_9NEOP|nr:hypothetical protein K1T71_010994 [Dendrolimus kikuchii]